VINLEALKNANATKIDVLFRKRNVSIMLVNGTDYVVHIRRKYPKPNEHLLCANYDEALKVFNEQFKRRKNKWVNT